MHHYRITQFQQAEINPTETDNIIQNLFISHSWLHKFEYIRAFSSNESIYGQVQNFVNKDAVVMVVLTVAVYQSIQKIVPMFANRIISRFKFENFLDIVKVPSL